jgi:WD40 repeat protein
MLSHGALSLSRVVLSGLVVGIFSGLAYGLRNGGIACIQHMFLRWLFWRAKAMPWNYPRFLDYAAKQILLSKVGGGYIFVHRLLLEYFATLEPLSMPSEDAVQAMQFSSTERGGRQTALPLNLEPAAPRMFSPFASRIPKRSYARNYRSSHRKALLGFTALIGLIVAAGSNSWWFLLPHPLSTLSGQTHVIGPYSHTVFWSPDATRLTLVDSDGRVQVWNVKDGTAISTTQRHPHDRYQGDEGYANWSSDHRRIAAISRGGAVNVWDMQDGGHVSTYQKPFHELSRFVTAIAWSYNGTRLAILDTQGTVQIRDTANGNHLLTYRISALKYPVTDQEPDLYRYLEELFWSPDGQRIVAIHYNGDRIELSIWDAANGGHFSTYPTYPIASEGVMHVEWSPDGKRLALAFGEGTIQVWDVMNGRVLLSYRGHTQVMALAWSSDGKYLASAGDFNDDKTVQVRDATNGALIHFYWLYPHGAATIVWSPDGKYLALGDYEGTIQVWRAS